MMLIILSVWQRWWRNHWFGWARWSCSSSWVKIAMLSLILIQQCIHYVKAKSNEWRGGWFKRWNWRGWQRGDWVQRVPGDHELYQAAADAGRGQQGGEAEAGLQQDRGARRQDSEGGPRQTSNRKYLDIYIIQSNICLLSRRFRNPSNNYSHLSPSVSSHDV